MSVLSPAWNIVQQGSNLPLAGGNLNFAPAQNTVAEIGQNVRMILTTAVESQTLDRAFGTNWDFLDQPFTVGQQALIAAAVAAISRFEPRAQVVMPVTFASPNPTTGQVVITIVIRVGAGITNPVSANFALGVATPISVIDFDSSGNPAVIQEIVSS